MIYTSWIPEDPDACARLLPPALKPAANHAVYMNQYVVDSAEQTTGFGVYSLTYLGVDVAEHLAPMELHRPGFSPTTSTHPRSCALMHRSGASRQPPDRPCWSATGKL